MEIINISRALFQNISEKYGKGEIKRVFGYNVSELDENKVNFPGAIGIKDDDYYSGPISVFVLWGLSPFNLSEDSDSRHIIEITTKSERAGAWAIDKGNRFRQVCQAIFPSGRINFSFPSSSFLPYILLLAYEMTQNADSQEFWEMDLKE